MSHHQVFQKQVLAPTGVEQCIKANLINDDSINLVLAKTNVLQIYNIRYEKIEKLETVTESEQDIFIQKKKIELKPSLELIIEKTLFGTIESMACVRYPNSERDSLILTFRDAKISVLDYNSDQLDFEIRSLHYFEKDDFKGGRNHFKHPPLLKVDTQQRCAVMLLYDRNIAVLPFKKTSSILDDDDDDEDEDNFEEEDDNVNNNKKIEIKNENFQQQQQQQQPHQSPKDKESADDEFDLLFEKDSTTTTTSTSTTIQKETETETETESTTKQEKDKNQEKKKKIKKLNSFIIDLKSIEIENVKDFCFLHGYYEPTILFLHEPIQTWTSRIAVKKLTCQMTAISLNLSTKAGSNIWNVSNFPYNCEMLVSVPEPLGGALVITANIMFYVNQTSKYGLAVNEYATIDTSTISGGQPFDFPIDDTLNLVFTLDRSNFVFLESDKFIGSLKGGELLIFHLISDGRSVQRIHVSKAGGSVLTSCICVLSNNLIFLGSRLGDSLLLQYTEKSITDDQLEHENFSNPYKKQKTSEVFDLFDENIEGKSNNNNNEEKASMASKLLEEIEDEEDELFKEKKNQLKSYQLGICDQIINIGPIGDMVIGQSIDPTYDETISPNQPEYVPKTLELVTCSGYGKNGSISVLQNNIKPELVMAFELPGITNAWTVYKEPTNDIDNDNNEINIKIGKKRSLDENEEKEDENEEEEEEEDQEEKIKKDKNWHDYLYLSLKDGTTLIFETGRDLKEVGKFNFKSLDIGNLFGRKRIVVIYQGGIKLINGFDSVIQDIQINEPIKSSYICDPFILLQFHNGTIQIFKGIDEENQLVQFQTNSIPNTLSQSIFSSSLFFDRNKSFLNINNKNQKSKESLNNQKSQQKQQQSKKKKDKSLGFLDSDDDDNESSEDEEMKDQQHEEEEEEEEEKVENEELKINDEDNIYLNIYTTNGCYEIYRLISQECIFKVSDVKFEYDLLGINSNESQDQILEQVLTPKSSLSKKQLQQHLQKQKENGITSKNNYNEIQNSEILDIVEISLHSLNNSDPYLFMFNKIGDLIVYKSFKREKNDELRFKKYNHSFILRDSVTEFYQKQQEKELLNGMDDDMDEDEKKKKKEEEEENLNRQKRIVEFSSISGKRGLFIGGKKPLWAFCEKGYLRLHSMDSSDNSSNGNSNNNNNNNENSTPANNVNTVETFTSFNNISCQDGFIYFSKDKDVIKICTLSTLMNFENDIAIRRIPTKNSCHKIAYHSEAKCYVVIVSFPQVTQELQEDSKKPILTDDKFQIKLIDPTIDWSWKFIDSFSLQDRETVLAMKIVSLKFTEPDGITRARPFLVIGTAFTFGEDTQCKGRVLVFEIVSHKTQFESEELGEKRLNLLYEKEQKGPVTALSSVNGLLLMTIGPKLTVNQFYTGSLITLSFYDAQIYICSICTIKNYIVIGDMYKSVYFLQWKDGKTLNLLSKDYQALNIFSTEFIVNQKTLSILVADLDKNILLFSFEPQDPASRSGQMLLTKADFHVGSNIEKFVRTPMKQLQQKYQQQQQQQQISKNENNIKKASSDYQVKNYQDNDNKLPKKKQLIIFGTLDGGLNVLRPLDEKIYLLFYHLQSKLYYLPQTAGLNPKQYRSFKSFSQNFHFSPSTYHQLPKFILDGDLISKFLSLSQSERRLISNSINSTSDEIIESLKDVFESWNLF
ncbi:hypothetical protein RB653_005993 [Dictyostelium firmibasis]|uniref:Cleavage/polyadenylation specificity factor A subunit C-terminal domain-containing protein n=1 Tax=Dictyostelium firmibasis TaxID=79012 RepID=A0AAN7U8N8_9MYCE